MNFGVEFPDDELAHVLFDLHFSVEARESPVEFPAVAAAARGRMADREVRGSPPDSFRTCRGLHGTGTVRRGHRNLTRRLRDVVDPEVEQSFVFFHQRDELLLGGERVGTAAHDEELEGDGLARPGSPERSLRAFRQRVGETQE